MYLNDGLRLGRWFRLYNTASYLSEPTLIQLIRIHLFVLAVAQGRIFNLQNKHLLVINNAILDHIDHPQAV